MLLCIDHNLNADKIQCELSFFAYLFYSKSVSKEKENSGHCGSISAVNVKQ